ncbi:hypothetical protein P3X46_026739 [Hevea brasiliensis]|uniref:PAS domain-containing protein n=1 Tax=Hevea brasiliensis TaxID=3981 RepID=A0ABQ9KZB0_HEVBR|nr:hypothetical protein P3X46_026739 [Hevea brasiliensis]
MEKEKAMDQENLSFNGSALSANDQYINREERRSIEIFDPPASNVEVGQPTSASSSRSHGIDTQAYIEGGSSKNFSSSSSSSSSWEPVNKWMAFERECAIKSKITCTDAITELKGNNVAATLTETSIAERTAEWGLVVKSDVGEGSFKAIKILSGHGDRSKYSSKRFAAESTRTSGESDAGAFPRVSQELKDALATLQQTFIVSDATKPDCPIMYASNGFFSLTGYSSKEVIGRNW